MDLLIVVTMSCILDHIAPFLIKFISSRLFTHTKYDSELRSELNSMKQEMAGISMVNEFARYARLQRKYNKLQAILKNNMQQLYSWRMKLQLSLISILRILNGLLLLLLLYTYEKTPIIILPGGVLWPIQGILSWPCQQENAISLFAWVIIAKLGLSTCMKLHV